MKLSLVLLFLLSFNAFSATLLCRGPLGTRFLEETQGVETPIRIFYLFLKFSEDKAGSDGIHLPKGHCALHNMPAAKGSDTSVQFRMENDFWSINVINNINSCASDENCVIQLYTTRSTTQDWNVNQSSNSVNNVIFSRPLKWSPILKPVTDLPPVTIVTPK